MNQMLKSRKVDYIVVGQGLAGSSVAVQLLKLGKRILVIDQPSQNTSSRIAAGLFNPITGKRVVKTWMADKIFPYLHDYYQSVETLTGRKFFYPMPLYRPFVSIGEQNEWMSKSAEPEFETYVDKVFTRSAFANVRDEHGGLVVRQCGYLDTRTYLEAVRSWIDKEGIFLGESLVDDDLDLDQNGVRYRQFQAKNIIFCHGVHGNRWFNWLPVRPLKGETITINTAYSQKLIINRGVYMVPDGHGSTWKVGATYNLHDNSPDTTPGARAELFEKMHELVDFPFEVVGQECGFRPTTNDRRPIIGAHPEWRCCHVFNGMGTKGVSLTPFFSGELIRSIENGAAINKEAAIDRYKILYHSGKG